MTPGMAMTATALLVGLATWLLLLPPARSVVARAGLRDRVHPTKPAAQQPVGSRLRLPAVLLAGLGLGLGLDGVTGWVMAVAAAVALDRWTARAVPRAERDRVRHRESALPGLVDLLVACLRAGATIPAAMTAVVPAAPPDLADELGAVVDRLARGATPAEAWVAAPDLQLVGRVLQRSAVTGAPAADLLDALADDLRQHRRASWLDQAGRLGVKAAAPLGLCFLPGFALLGVAPVVVGLASNYW